MGVSRPRQRPPAGPSHVHTRPPALQSDARDPARAPSRDRGSGPSGELALCRHGRGRRSRARRRSPATTARGALAAGFGGGSLGRRGPRLHTGCARLSGTRKTPLSLRGGGGLWWPPAIHGHGLRQAAPWWPARSPPRGGAAGPLLGGARGGRRQRNRWDRGRGSRRQRGPVVVLGRRAGHRGTGSVLARVLCGGPDGRPGADAPSPAYPRSPLTPRRDHRTHHHVGAGHAPLRPRLYRVEFHRASHRPAGGRRRRTALAGRVDGLAGDFDPRGVDRPPDREKCDDLHGRAGGRTARGAGAPGAPDPAGGPGRRPSAALSPSVDSGEPRARAGSRLRPGARRRRGLVRGVDLGHHARSPRTRPGPSASRPSSPTAAAPSAARGCAPG